MPNAPFVSFLSFFLSPHPPQLEHRFTNTFAMRRKCRFIFTLSSSGISLFRMLWGSLCHPSRHHTLTKATAWTGQWSPWTGSLQQAGCFCSSLISHQAWHCHLPWSSGVEQSGCPCEKMQLLVQQVTWWELGVNLYFIEDLLFLPCPGFLGNNWIPGFKIT